MRSVVLSILALAAACDGGSSKLLADAAFDATPDASSDAPPGVAVLAGSTLFYDFGPVGTASSGYLDFWVTNVGNGVSGVPIGRMEGNDPSVFFATTAAGPFPCLNPIAPSFGCVFRISAGTSTPGPKSARFVVTGGSTDLVLDLAITGIPEPHLFLLSPDYWASQAVHVGTTTPEVELTVWNGGAASTGPIDVTLDSIGPGAFSIASNGCVDLAPGEMCTVGVVFHPIWVGGADTWVKIKGTAGPSVVAFLAGTGTNDDLGFTPTASDLDVIFVGFRTRARTFNITNTVSTTSDPLTVTLDGTDAAEFELVDDTCTGNALAPGVTCTVGVEALATTTGNKTANVRVATATTPSVVATLKAMAHFTISYLLSITPASTNFGTVTVGQTSVATTVNVMNLSYTHYAGSLQVSLNGPQSSRFVLTNDSCNLNDLAPRATCTVDVQFQPGATGTVGADLMIIGGNGSTNVALTGTGN